MPFNTLLSYQTDLARGVTRTPIRPALLTQDSQAHTIRVACVRAGSAESLNGASVRGYLAFSRVMPRAVPLMFSREKKGNSGPTSATWRETISISE